MIKVRDNAVPTDLYQYMTKWGSIAEITVLKVIGGWQVVVKASWENETVGAASPETGEESLHLAVLRVILDIGAELRSIAARTGRKIDSLFEEGAVRKVMGSHSPIGEAMDAVEAVLGAPPEVLARWIHNDLRPAALMTFPRLELKLVSSSTGEEVKAESLWGLVTH